MVLNKPLRIYFMWITPLNVASKSKYQYLISPSLVPTCSRVAAPPDVWKAITYRAPPRLLVSSAWHVVPVAKVTHRSWWTPRGTGLRLQLGSLGRWKRVNEELKPLTGTVTREANPLSVSSATSPVSNPDGLYPRAQVRSFPYTSRHVSHPPPHAQAMQASQSNPWLTN